MTENYSTAFPELNSKHKSFHVHYSICSLSIASGGLNNQCLRNPVFFVLV